MNGQSVRLFMEDGFVSCRVVSSREKIWSYNPATVGDCNRLNFIHPFLIKMDLKTN